MASPINVRTQNGEYLVHIGFNLLEQSPFFSPWLGSKKVIILTNPLIAKHYLAILKHTCHEAGASNVESFIIPAGEAHKTLFMADQIWAYLLEHNFYRDSVVIALGGGMVGDLAGFAAACFMRGISFIQCPTSLLAQIDAAIGGKTAVNHAADKNMIGAFHAPKVVIADLATLATLPEREYRSGLAELIKYGLAFDANLFNWIEDNLTALLRRDENALQYAIESAVRIKAAIVSADEKEQGERILLNFGHTVAHALESLLDYKLLLHGEAVALGMIIATDLAIEQQWISSSVFNRLLTLLTEAQLPITLPKEISVAAILSKIKQDKKHTQHALRWVLLKNIGEAQICDTVTILQLTQALVRRG